MSREDQNGNPMIESVELGKFYGDFAAAQNITFSVPRGQVCAFLGPNGAGKSTTMKMLTGFLAPCEGTARIAGHDVCTDRLEAAKQLGYLPENGPLYSDMTPKTFLTHVGEHGVSRRSVWRNDLTTWRRHVRCGTFGRKPSANSHAVIDRESAWLRR